MHTVGNGSVGRRPLCTLATVSKLLGTPPPAPAPASTTTSATTSATTKPPVRPDGALTDMFKLAADGTNSEGGCSGIDGYRQGGYKPILDGGECKRAAKQLELV